MRFPMAIVFGVVLLAGNIHCGDTSSYLEEALRINGFHFRLENDMYGLARNTTDEHYTNGFQALFPLRHDPDRDPEQRPWIRPCCDPEMTISSGYLISQTMYTPSIIDTPDALPGDRPYGGLLTFGKYQSILFHPPGDKKPVPPVPLPSIPVADTSVPPGPAVDTSIASNSAGAGDTSLAEEDPPSNEPFHRERLEEGKKRLADTRKVNGRLTYKFMVGWMGEASFAEEAQTWVHENIASAPRPEGWHHQVPGEPVLQLNSRLEWELAEIDSLTSIEFQDRNLRVADILGSVGMDLGNAYTNFNLGMMFRLGIYMQSYFTSGTENVITKRGEAPGSGAFYNWLINSQIYLFAEPRAFLVARNALIHCGINDCEVKQEVRPFVFDVETGVRGSIPFFCDLELSGAYLVAWRSMEHKAAPWGLFSHRFGAWQVGIVYRPR